MDLGILVPLAPFLMIVGIVWVRTHAKLEEKRIAATAENSAEKAAQYATRVSELEERVQVLERIVTDRGYDVATQIEALRDQRRVDDLLEERSKVQ
jgi:Phage shock protein B.